MFDQDSSKQRCWRAPRRRLPPSTYASDGPLGVDELAHLDAFSRLREAVQGAYLADRLATNDLTGGVDHAENAKGLSDARRRWEALSTG